MEDVTMSTTAHTDPLMATSVDTATTMRALVQEGYGSADCLEVRETSRPEVVPGRVLVRMRAASVNALDWHTTHGGRFLELMGKLMRQQDDPIRGVDVAGTIEAVGEGVSRFRPGDDVFGAAPASFAEFVLAREERLLAKPSALSFEAASTINVAGRTALQALRDHAQVKSGDHVLIHGAGGGVGTYAVQIAKVLGADVTAVTSPRNVELVKTLGADAVLDTPGADLRGRPERYDAVVDIAAVRPVAELRGLLKPGGTYVLVGAAKNGWFGVFARILVVAVRSRLLRQRVRFFVARQGLDDLAFLADLVAAGRVRPAIDRTYPLAEGREAVRYVGTGQARAKVVITP
jgi:NADPH:quinone reductase-like Zn-dependent oxidoreductase